jgi:hypothetical protein
MKISISYIIHLASLIGICRDSCVINKAGIEPLCKRVSGITGKLLDDLSPAHGGIEAEEVFQGGQTGGSRGKEDYILAGFSQLRGSGFRF